MNPLSPEPDQGLRHGLPLPAPEVRARRSILVRGIVQGVGFRPYVHTLASRLGLVGFVRNQADGVRIEIEGDLGALERFVTALQGDPPARARIDAVQLATRVTEGGLAFRIEPSQDIEAAGPVLLAADSATCEPCVRDVSDPAGRRYGHPFTSCATCGPRLTIIESTPYDRARTTMARFALCAACRAEYEDPRDRRFHAQTNACPACGPRLALLDAHGDPTPSADPLASAVLALRAGQIVAVKGIGGYHLACDATDEVAVGTLRRRKHRDEKPFAVMAALSAVEALCEVSAEERSVLLSPERPIVLLRRRPGVGIARGVAPGNPLLGAMIPYSPLHHLLTQAMKGRPLVLTSGNRSDEPIACEDRDAVERLRGIADLFLVHDRPIALRCDDSVARVIGTRPVVIRRSRGYAPRPLALPVACRHPALALGGHLKAAFALGSGNRALLSHHIGDLDDHAVYRSYVDAIVHYERLFRTRPALLVHDLHPEYASTLYAEDRAAAEGLPRLPVQHHHAHMAAVLAEHALTRPAIGVTFDGTGYGTDGAVWGGEFLVGDCASFRRAAHLRYVALPGGERAVREPWRMAVSHLVDAEAQDEIAPTFAARVPADALRTIHRMIERRIHSPACSSMGRLFDAVAALAGLRDRAFFEAQAAIEMEGLAAQVPSDGVTYPFDLGSAVDPIVIDTRPLVRAVVADLRRGAGGGRIARRFHDTVALLVVTVCRRLREQTGLGTVVLSGGVFQNAVLAEEASAQLAGAGFGVYRSREVPPNDGGLAYGQLAVAAARAAAEPEEAH